MLARGISDHIFSTVQALAPTLNVEVIRDSVLATVLALVVDPIPNIRFNVAKALEVLGVALATSGTPEAKELLSSRVVPAVQALKADSDADVRFFATKAMDRIFSTKVICE